MIQAVQSIRQEFDAKLAQMSKRNARLWLLDEANNLGRKKLSALLQFRSVLAAIKLYTLFPHGKFASDRALLEKALQVCDGLLIPTQTLADLKYSLSIHLSNLYVAHSEFYDALDCLHAIYLTESERSRRGVCLINMARCKLWLRDFSDVAAIIKQVESLGPIDPSVSPYHVAIKVRLALLVGDTKSARAYPEDLTNQTIEMAYL